jgi:hypothetical protein
MTSSIMKLCSRRKKQKTQVAYRETTQELP